MKLLLKIFFYLIIALLLLLVGASITLRFVLKPDVIKSLISTQVQNYTGRTLTIGKLDYTLFPTFKLELNNVSLSNSPKFGNTPFFTINEASLGVRIKPLLDNEVILTGIKVNGIELNLNQNGPANNWQDLATPSTKPNNNKTVSVKTKNSYLNIPFINLQNLNINYQNGSNLTQLSNLYLTAQNIRNNLSFFNFSAGSNISQSSPLLNANWQITGQASISKNFLQYQLRNVAITGQVINSQGQKKFTLSNLQTTLLISPTQISIQPFSANLYSGQLTGNAIMRLQTPTSYQLNLNLQGLDLKAFLSDIANNQKISGQANVQASLTTKGQNSQQLMQNLSGNGSLNISQIKAQGVDIGILYREALAMIEQNKTNMNFDFGDSSKIGNLTGNFNIANGVLNTQNTQFISPVIRASLTGNADIANQTLNFIADVTPVRGSLENLKDNGPTIPFNISGSFTQPKATPNLGGLLKNAMKERMNDELKKVKDHLPDLSNSLRGLFGN